MLHFSHLQYLGHDPLPSDGVLVLHDDPFLRVLAIPRGHSHGLVVPVPVCGSRCCAWRWCSCWWRCAGTPSSWPGLSDGNPSCPGWPRSASSWRVTQASARACCGHPPALHASGETVPQHVPQTFDPAPQRLALFEFGSDDAVLDYRPHHVPDVVRVLPPAQFRIDVTEEFLEWAAAVSGEDTHPDLSSAQPAQEEFSGQWLRTPPTLKQYKKILHNTTPYN